MLVIAIYVLDATASPLLVASMLMLRLLPLSIFGLFSGVIAQRFNRWRLLRWASLVQVIQALTIFGLSYLDVLQVWHVGAAAFMSGLVWSTDFPVRRTLMSDFAGTTRVSRAMSLDLLAGSATRILGPLLGGLLYEQIGLQGAFFLSMSLYAAGWLALSVHQGRFPQQQQSAERPAGQSIFHSLREGLGVLRQSATLPGVLAVTIVFNLWGFPFVSMVPVVAKEVLTLSDSLTGVLTSAEGLGALLGAGLLSAFARSEHSRYLYLGGVVCYCLFALAFSFSTLPWLSAGCLLLVGLVSAAFGSMQSALVLMNAPKGYERQMMGVLSVCIGTAPLGFLHIGLLADWLGPAHACAIAAAEGLAAMMLVLWRWPQLISPQPVA